MDKKHLLYTSIHWVFHVMTAIYLATPRSNIFAMHRSFTEIWSKHLRGFGFTHFFAVLFRSGNVPKFAFDCKVAYRVLKHLNFEDYSLGWEVPTLWKMFGTCISRPEGRERADWAARCAKLLAFLARKLCKSFADLEFGMSCFSIFHWLKWS